MSRLHVLDGTGTPNTFRIVLHEATPGGNNSAGITWVLALVNSGRAHTVMTEGAGAGQITTAEKAAVEAGTTLEATFTFTVDPAWNATTRNAALDAEATKLLAETQAKLAAELKWFGAVRA